MKKTPCVLILLFCLLSDSVISQTWFRTYGGNINTETNKLFEHYDKGYVLSGERYGNGSTCYGWVLKTDINGYERWSKSYGYTNKMVILYGAKPTNDGGIIEIGVSNKLNSNCTNPLVIKLNACGEKEWCKLYNAQNCNSGGYDIVPISDGGYMALIDHWTNNQQKLIWLFRLDSLGGVIWSQTYATDTIFVDEWSHSLLMTSDSNFVITAETYYPDSSLPPNNYILKILLIKVNINGIAQFTEPWGTNNGVISDGRVSIIDAENNIYTAGRRQRTVSPGGDSPCLFYTNPTGQSIYYNDLKSNSLLGEATTVNWLQDSTLVICAGWKDQSGNDTTGLIKTTQTGNFIKQKALMFNQDNILRGSGITYNFRILIGGSVFNPTSVNWQSYLFKLTSNLEYDSTYTRPFTYDSLCPHPIVSDTIPLNDCQVVIVGLDDAEKNPEKAKLHIYPNPAVGEVIIEMPQYLVRKNQGSGITATTTYFQWNQTRIDMLDLTGKLLYSQDIPKQQTQVKLDVSAWPAGMYLARIVFMNEVVAEAKFIKQGKK